MHKKVIEFCGALGHSIFKASTDETINGGQHFLSTTICNRRTTFVAFLCIHAPDSLLPIKSNLDMIVVTHTEKIPYRDGTTCRHF